VIILNIASRTVGIVVDSVSDVIELHPGDVRPAPEFSSVIDSSYITGLGTLKQGEGNNQEERMLILMDIEQLMSSPDMGLTGLSLH
jgi:purine-binding chemotaxis protein CheW